MTLEPQAKSAFQLGLIAIVILIVSAILFSFLFIYRAGLIEILFILFLGFIGSIIAVISFLKALKSRKIINTNPNLYAGKEYLYSDWLII